MTVLAVESATELAGVAVADGSGVLAATAVAGRRHGETIAPGVQFVCRSAGVQLGELDALAVDIGPGLFTGLRVGVATVKALAFALGLPVVTMTSLELLALGALRLGLVGPGDDTVVVPVVDARRGLLFSASFVATGDGLQLVGDEELGAPEELLRHLQTTTAGGRRCLCVGDGARRYAAALAEVPGADVAGPAMAHPDAAVLAMVGDERRAAGTAVAGEEVAARYLREADVRINWEQRMAPRPVGG